MKTTITADLNRAYLRKLERHNYLATTCSVVIVTISVFCCLFSIGGFKDLDLFSNIMYPLSSTIGAFFACVTAWRARLGAVRLAQRHQLAWLLIGLGLLANSLGGLYYTYLEQTGSINPVPSFADLGFTLFYPLTFAGLLIMMPTAVHFRKRIALDAFITTLCIFGIMWYFFIDTIFTVNAADGGWANVISVSYPVWDMLLILAILLLMLNRTEAIIRTSLIVFAAGILCQIWADTGYAYGLARGFYYTGLPYIDPFWFMGYLLFGLSALYQYSIIAHRAYNKSTHLAQAAAPLDGLAFRRAKKSQRYRLRIQKMLIYLPLGVLLIILLYNEFAEGAHSSLLAQVLTSITAVVGILVTARHVIATRENDILFLEREQERQEAERLRVLATELTSILDLDRLCERIVSSATSEFGFDGAILILLEKYALPFAEHTRLRIVASASAAKAAISWSFPGVQTGKCDLLVEQERNVVLNGQQMDLPAELEAWQQEHNIRSALFVPLIYQEHMLGTLCFASCSEQHFSEHDTHFARTYAEQIAPAIEHTRLYQTICERETFVKAMANIATRLNSAVVEPAEIYELICSEAASALRADHVVLYGLNGGEHLFPLASFSAEQEPLAAPNDWPTIALHEYEGQVINTLQPVLMQLQPIHASCRKQPEAISSAYRLTKDTVKLPLAGLNREADNHAPSLLRQKLMRKYVHTAIIAPLIAGGDPIGLLILARSPSPAAHDQILFIKDDLPLVQNFAEQAVVALTNAQLYERLRSAHQRQQELDQLKDQFMIMASHELRTPLTSVQGYIELISQYDEIMPGEQRREFLQKAQRNCDELVVLLHNVMDASRLEIEAGIRSTYTERVLVKDMIDTIIDLFEPHLTHEQREVHISIPPQLAVYADPSRLRQVLVNLSANALKYSQPQTPIKYSAHAILDHNRYAIISVTDKGKGITLQDQARLFERFVRLESDINSPVRGSGLGLYISRRFAEAMGGKIWIESNGIPGEGSTFHVQLPLA